MKPRFVIRVFVFQVAFWFWLESCHSQVTPITGGGALLNYWDTEWCECDCDFGGVRDFASDPNGTNTFWAVTEAFRTDGDIELLQIDLKLDQPPTRYLLDTTEPVLGLAIDSNERFYGITANDLVLIDPPTGSVETVGSLQLSEDARLSTSLAMHPDGTLYGAIGDRIVTIAKTNGKANEIGRFDGISFRGIAFNPDSGSLQGHGIDDDYKYFDIDLDT